MAKLTFDITGLYNLAFGGVQRGKPFDKKLLTPRRIAQEEFQAVPATNDQEGTEFVNLRSSLAANLPNGQSVFMPMRLGGVMLPNEPTIQISSRKNIVETVLSGSTRRGTVKELISIEDWSVVIRGVALNYKSKLVYPEDQVKALRDLYERNEALTVECALTSLLGIYRLVIKDFTLPEMTGIQHAQAYQFTCVSDEDFILEL